MPPVALPFPEPFPSYHARVDYNRQFPTFVAFHFLYFVFQVCLFLFLNYSCSCFWTIVGVPGGTVKGASY
jgi:hypothetical protein